MTPEQILDYNTTDWEDCGACLAVNDNPCPYHQGRIDESKANPLDAAVEEFINERPGYITALRNTPGDGSQADYYRWQGHAEARRQLAQKLGWTVPHEPGDSTDRNEQ